MQRHLSTGSHFLAAMMRADRSAVPDQHRADPLRDVIQLLAQQEQDEPGDARPN